MREISELIAYLGQLDIKIWLDEGRLKVNGPKSSINNLLKEELSARKDELINFILSKSNDNNKYVISKLSPDQRAPLTYGQERIWSLVKINPDAGTYHIPFAFRLIGKLDLVALGKALTVIHHRHDLLRTVFQGEDIATAHQVVKFKSAAPFSLADVSKDLALLNPDEFEVQLNSLLETDVNQPFDIVNGPLWRARLFQIGVEKYLLSFTFHHLIFDGFSKNLFLDELLLAYDAASKGSKLDPKPFTIQYGDFSAWQKLTFDDQAIKNQLVYWEEKFQRECPSIITPNDFPRNETLGGSALVRFSVPKRPGIRFPGKVLPGVVPDPKDP